MTLEEAKEAARKAKAEKAKSVDLSEIEGYGKKSPEEKQRILDAVRRAWSGEDQE
jgi:hypothetical protein